MAKITQAQENALVRAGIGRLFVREARNYQITPEAQRPKFDPSFVERRDSREYFILGY